MKTKVLEAKVRKATATKSDLTQLRASGRVPGVFYSRLNDAVNLDVHANEINPLVFTAETHLVSLKLDNGAHHECVIKDVQFDPVTDKIIHFDLFGLNQDEKVSIEVPVMLTGSSIGVRQGGQLQTNMHKLHIECLPADIPQHLMIDVSGLKLGKSILVGDLSFEKIEILHPADALVATVSIPRGLDISTIAEEEVKEPEVIAKGKDKSAE